MRLRDILKAPDAFDPILAISIDNYITNPNSPREGKLQALAKLDTVLGLPKPADPNYALNVYLAIPDAAAVFTEQSPRSEFDDGRRFDPNEVGPRGDITREQLYATDLDEDEDWEEGEDEDWESDYGH